ncbi:Zn(II)2Cys6 transcription factor domain-containing protein [Aspergillus fijiensis CBS 313.89]|uniref:Zn(2)-C6 fungal-type domain-containing protein n=1 Tax=Aspergillus fijiensis CBS 313.89 TaxID=1448319 RepID=A0A8G1RIX5_9EURO|nr:uncharacterized protein BO72DRAFT_279483 [Aspergillus fijiensis CBS 313.89]RAK72296.1 hypothetical protein BO72DRAFT_279483 [Aspergillus fijiensis CBS 313.89]
MKVMLVACESCRQRKRKCDRAYPSCALCHKTGRKCFYAIYRVTDPIHEKQKLNAPVAVEYCKENPRDISPDSWEAVSDQLSLSWAIQSPTVPESYPIAYRWYMPKLIKHFHNGLGVAQIPVTAKCSAYKLQTVWLRSAMEDPCLFHATLFAGSSHFDICRGQKQSMITLYHYNELIKLVKKRLADPATALDDRTIASITPLALFANLGGDRASAEVHRAGLENMVLLRGGMHNLGLDGLISSLIHMNRIVSNIVFDLGLSTGPQFQLMPPLSLEERILNMPTRPPGPDNFTCSIKALFQHVHQTKLHLMTSHPTDHWRQDTPATRTMPPPTTEDPIYQCCYLACKIFQTIADGGANGCSFVEYLDALARNLRDALALTDEEVWLRHFPVPHTWACITGAAASSDSQIRTWFYFRQASTARILNIDGDYTFLDDLSSHFDWLRSLRRAALQLDDEKAV